MSGVINCLEPVVILAISKCYAAVKVCPVITAIDTVLNFCTIVVNVTCTGCQSNCTLAPDTAVIIVGVEIQNRSSVIFDRDLDIAADFGTGSENVGGNHFDNKIAIGIGSRESIPGDFFIVNKVSIGIV